MLKINIEQNIAYQVIEFAVFLLRHTNKNMHYKKEWLCHNTDLITLKKSSYAHLTRAAMLQYGSFPQYGTFLQCGFFPQ